MESDAVILHGFKQTASQEKHCKYVLIAINCHEVRRCLSLRGTEDKQKLLCVHIANILLRKNIQAHDPFGNLKTFTVTQLSSAVEFTRKVVTIYNSRMIH